ncbi:MAG: hypothetical protein M3O06_10035 [Pseudomonadota bacterium]|nr:hypothetical protein [Pseudomonadota bacterium]
MHQCLVGLMGRQEVHRRMGGADVEHQLLARGHLSQDRRVKLEKRGLTL